jgi:hypothetical protein
LAQAPQADDKDVWDLDLGLTSSWTRARTQARMPTWADEGDVYFEFYDAWDRDQDPWDQDPDDKGP